MRLTVKLNLCKLLLAVTWIPFGYLPFFISLSNYTWIRGSDLLSFLIVEFVLIVIGINGIIGMLTFRKQYLAKEMAITILMIRIITNLQTSTIASLNVTLLFFIWNIWVLGEKYTQFDSEYHYPKNGIEKEDINLAFQRQLQGFFLVGWIILIGSWMIVFITEAIIIDLGATLTISIFLGLILVLLVKLSEDFAIFSNN